MRFHTTQNGTLASQGSDPAHGPRSRGREDERGTMAVLMGLVIVLVFGFGALAVDIGSGLVTKAELQNTSDAATLATAYELGVIYRELGRSTSYKTYTLTSADEARLLAKAAEFAGANSAGGKSVSVRAADLVYGTYDGATGEITPSKTGVRAVSLVSRRDDQANGALPAILAGVLGVNSIPVRAQSAAALTALGTLDAGKSDIPVGISQYWFDSGSCDAGDNSIKFFPTGSLDGCAGWHTYTEWPASASRLNKILDDLEDGTFSSPETTAGEDSYNFTGGTLASRFSDMKSLYDAKKNDAGNWTVTVPVYQASDCSNPTGAIVIAGFARATIYEVTDAPEKTISAHVECGIFDSSDLGDGGGANDYGTLIASPLMIQ